MARARQAAQPTLERSIYFYRVDAGSDDAGRLIEFDAGPTLAHIDRLPFNAAGRYLAQADGNALCCWVDDASSRGRLRLASVRRSGLPQVDQAGALTPLNIPQTAGLVEQIHVVFFPHQIVGVDFNFYGPRLSRLSSYFLEKAPGVGPQVSFEPLIRQDVTEQLRRLQDIRLFQLRIRESYADTLAEADESLGAAFQAARECGDADELEIILRPRRFSRDNIGNRLLGVAKRLARLAGLREEATKFQVKGLDSETDKTELVDVLSDKLIAKKQIVQQNTRTRALVTDSAYEAIREAYTELRTELVAAAGVVQ